MTKERLRRYGALRLEAAQLRDRLSEVEAAMQAPQGQQLTGMPCSGSGESRTAEALTVQHLTLLEHYRDKLTALAAEQLAIEQAIDTLGQQERMLMRYRYLDGLSWEEVCAAMHYSWRQVHRIHASALRQLADKK